MKQELKEIIESSSFKVHPGSWVYAKVSKQPQIEDVFMISRDEDEITAVFEQKNESKMDILEKNKDLRRLIEIKVSKPFYAVGFLAAIASAISSKGCNNLIISTYSKDYFMVTEAQFDTAKSALLELGFSEDKS